MFVGRFVGSTVGGSVIICYFESRISTKYIKYIKYT